MVLANKELYSQSNNKNIGLILYNLLQLSKSEMILKAKVYVYINFQQIKRQWFFYLKHTINFMQNIIKIYQKLVFLPLNLDIILLKPISGSDNDNRAINQ